MHIHGEPNEVAELFTALAVARKGFGVVQKDRTVEVELKNGGGYSYTYATMEEILDKTALALAEQGIVVLQPFERTNDTIVCRLIVAKAGARIVIETSFEAVDRWIDRNTGEPRQAPMNIQDLGGQLTYHQRYMYSKFFNLSADSDADDAPQREEGSRAESASRRPAARAAAGEAKGAPNGQPTQNRPTPAQLERYKALAKAAKLEPASASELCQKVAGCAPSNLTVETMEKVLVHLEGLTGATANA